MKCAGCLFSLPCSPNIGIPLNHFLSLLFKMHCWNSIALFCLCTASDKIPPAVNVANQTPPHAILWRCSMSVPRSPPAVDCRECQEVAAADSPTYPSLSRAETLQTLQCLSYAPGPLHLAVTSLLIPAVSCSLSPFTTTYPFVLWNATCRTIFPFSSVLYLLKNLYFFSLPGETVFELLVCPTSAFSPNYLSLYSHGAVFSLLGPHHCLLHLSHCFFC